MYKITENMWHHILQNYNIQWLHNELDKKVHYKPHKYNNYSAELTEENFTHYGYLVIF